MLNNIYNDYINNFNRLSLVIPAFWLFLIIIDKYVIITIILFIIIISIFIELSEDINFL